MRTSLVAHLYVFRECTFVYCCVFFVNVYAAASASCCQSKKRLNHISNQAYEDHPIPAYTKWPTGHTHTNTQRESESVSLIIHVASPEEYVLQIRLAFLCMCCCTFCIVRTRVCVLASEWGHFGWSVLGVKTSSGATIHEWCNSKNNCNCLKSIPHFLFISLVKSFYRFFQYVHKHASWLWLLPYIQMEAVRYFCSIVGKALHFRVMFTADYAIKQLY